MNADLIYRFYIVTDGRYNFSVMEDKIDFSIIEYLHKFNNHTELIIYRIDGRTGTIGPVQTVMIGTLDEIYKSMKGEKE